MNARTILGSFEHISIPLLGVHDVVAKIDTGAYSGALHCSSIRTIVRKSDGKEVLRFIPYDNPSYATETEQFTVVKVRSSNGHEVKRYIINTVVVIRGEEYSIRIGLADRSVMQYEVLIGRRFLREKNMLVDVCLGQEMDKDKEGEKYENSNSF